MIDRVFSIAKFKPFASLAEGFFATFENIFVKTIDKFLIMWYNIILNFDMAYFPIISIAIKVDTYTIE